MTDLISRVAAVIQARTIARLGQALPNHVCMDFAQAAVTAQREWDAEALGPDGMNKLRLFMLRTPYIPRDGIGGTDGPPYGKSPAMEAMDVGEVVRR